MSEHLPLIVVEIVMIFGGALAFAWWQLRDLAREKRKKQEREAQRIGQAEGKDTGTGAGVSPGAGERTGRDAPGAGKVNGHAA
jgi:hypothetical protein